MQSQEVVYTHNDTTLSGLLCFNDKQTRPGILIAPDWSGRKQEYLDYAERMAARGYTSFIVDMFGEGRVEVCKEKKLRLILPFLEHRDQLQHRMLTALQTFCEFDFIDRTRLAAIGYCFGGMCALDLARIGAPLSGVVSVHGLLTPPNNLPQSDIQARVLALHGNEDRIVTERDLREFSNEMNQAKTDWQLQIYGNAMHAFTSPNANDDRFGARYNSSVTQQAFKQIDLFLEECFA